MSGATHDSQFAPRSGVQARLARNLNVRDDSDATPFHSITVPVVQFFGWPSCLPWQPWPIRLPNLFGGPSGSVRTGLTGIRSEPGPQTYLTSLIACPTTNHRPMKGQEAKSGQCSSYINQWWWAASTETIWFRVHIFRLVSHTLS